MYRTLSIACSLGLAACAPSAASRRAPTGARAEPTTALWLHAVDLEISHAEVRRSGVTTAARIVPGTFGRIGVIPAAPLQAGAATLVLTYRAKLDSTKSRGAYREREAGAYYAYTFFEATAARRAFPCFDEPGFKIPWTLAFHLKAGDVAVANTEIRDQATDAAGLTVTRFAPTRPLPSYLVAFLVGPFDAVTSKEGPNGRPIRFYVPKGRGGEAKYAQAITPELVRILETQIGVPDPYEKLDVAVVPRFWGAMKSAGEMPNREDVAAPPRRPARGQPRCFSRR